MCIVLNLVIHLSTVVACSSWMGARSYAPLAARSGSPRCVYGGRHNGRTSGGCARFCEAGSGENAVAVCEIDKISFLA